MTKPGYTPWVRKVNVRPQEPLTVDVVLTEAGREELITPVEASSSYTPWVVIGTGAALVGGGVFTGLSAQGLYSDLEARRDDQLLIAEDDIEVGNRWVMMTNILLGLGITSLTTGGVLWMMEPSSDDRSAPRRPRPIGAQAHQTTTLPSSLPNQESEMPLIPSLINANIEVTQ